MLMPCVFRGYGAFARHRGGCFSLFITAVWQPCCWVGGCRDSRALTCMPGWPHCLCKQEGQRGPELNTERGRVNWRSKKKKMPLKLHTLIFFNHILSDHDENCAMQLEFKFVVENLTEKYLKVSQSLQILQGTNYKSTTGKSLEDLYPIYSFVFKVMSNLSLNFQYSPPELKVTRHSLGLFHLSLASDKSH